jgi:hypothetical protein
MTIDRSRLLWLLAPLATTVVTLIVLQGIHPSAGAILVLPASSDLALQLNGSIDLQSLKQLRGIVLLCPFGKPA